jgi:hypothetical protein
MTIPPCGNFSKHISQTFLNHSSISENRSFETEEFPSAIETYTFNLTEDLIKDNIQRNTAVKNNLTLSQQIISFIVV